MRKPRRLPETWSVALISASLVIVHVLDVALDLGWRSACAIHADAIRSALAVLAHDPLSTDAWLVLSTVFSGTMMHADLTHLGSNLVFFWLFGSLLAKVAGSRWVLVTFVVTAATAAAAFVLRHDGLTPVAMIGASGAISGVGGAYALLAFRWEVPDAYAWPLARPIPPAHAAAFALLSAAFDVYVLAESHGMSDGVARDAHIGGFAGGLVLAMILTTAYPTRAAFLASMLGGRRR